ncbi:hypothetical protein HA052_19575 [Chromobacterium haemolyticum]|uniref:Uncharacterized protein n=1 Tax=Chromobacterium fluminis TaxID=3044269 RepID=A0ABX0LCY9_9NEIS|nr:hypothetical protein [Chromobacterium haemolyticum]NHR07394.1 hypothetical protein [Chromobacterium haemolyticum]
MRTFITVEMNRQRERHILFLGVTPGLVVGTLAFSLSAIAAQVGMREDLCYDEQGGYSIGAIVIRGKQHYRCAEISAPREGEPVVHTGAAWVSYWESPDELSDDETDGEVVDAVKVTVYKASAND